MLKMVRIARTYWETYFPSFSQKGAKERKIEVTTTWVLEQSIGKMKVSTIRNLGFSIE